VIPLNYGVLLVTRAEWGARPPRSVTGLSAGITTSHWEGPHLGEFPHSSCASKVRGIQNFHMDTRGWADIAYNGVGCPHGYVFAGRGPGVRSAANGTTAGNNGAFAVCYLGGQGDPFTDDGARAMKAGGDWLTWPGSGRNCHRDWTATECPGNTICSWTHNGQPITWGPPPVPKDWFDMATKEELEAVVRSMGPWLGQVDGDPSGALFVFHAGIRTWIATSAAVSVQVFYFRNLHTDSGRPWTPTLEEAQGFHLINRAELEAHLGHPYEF
jgi:hypothetical protein